MQQGPAFEKISFGQGTGVLLLCDHAANHVPESVSANRLGLPPDDLDRHIAYDVGARSVTLLLAQQLGATAICSRFSRLVIDPNRGEDDPTLIMRLYDGSIIPGNRRLDPDQVAHRLDSFHRPYHAAISAEIDAALAAGPTPALVSVHSFTPSLRGRQKRPWHVGILWDHDPRLAMPLIRALEGIDGLVVGDNEPYSGRLHGDTMYRHGLQRGLPHVLIEFRNDLIADEQGQRLWADRILQPLKTALEHANG